MPSHGPVPSSIVIVGAGVFGLSTAYALSRREEYAQTKITLIAPFTAQELIGSNDTTRIVRADYADPVYCALGEAALKEWRGDFGANGRYNEAGLVITAGQCGRLEAVDYVLKSQENVRSLNAANGGHEESSVEELEDRESIAKAAGVTASGDFGYANWRSGWGDAGASLAYLKRRLEDAGKVSLVDGRVKDLVFSDDRLTVNGVELDGGERYQADLTILATGAWTPQLVDLRGIASARGQCMLYVDLTDEEAEKLKRIPVHFNLDAGTFYFPPTRRRNDGGWEIKIARHAYGYARPADVKGVVGMDGRMVDIQASLPWFSSELPTVDAQHLEGFMKKCFPELEQSWGDRKTRSRMCWYLDTLNANWLICPHPHFTSRNGEGYQGPSLFLATGGSGHAFKFFPVLGEKVVDILNGADDSEHSREMTRKWGWRDRVEDDEIWCDEATRGGKRGLYLRH